MIAGFTVSLVCIRRSGIEMLVSCASFDSVRLHVMNIKLCNCQAPSDYRFVLFVPIILLQSCFYLSIHFDLNGIYSVRPARILALSSSVNSPNLPGVLKLLHGQTRVTNLLQRKKHASSPATRPRETLSPSIICRDIFIIRACNHNPTVLSRRMQSKLTALDTVPQSNGR